MSSRTFFAYIVISHTVPSARRQSDPLRIHRTLRALYIERNARRTPVSKGEVGTVSKLVTRLSRASQMILARISYRAHRFVLQLRPASNYTIASGVLCETFCTKKSGGSSPSYPRPVANSKRVADCVRHRGNPAGSRCVVMSVRLHRIVAVQVPHRDPRTVASTPPPSVATSNAPRPRRDLAAIERREGALTGSPGILLHIEGVIDRLGVTGRA